MTEFNSFEESILDYIAKTYPNSSPVVNIGYLENNEIGLEILLNGYRFLWLKFNCSFSPDNEYFMFQSVLWHIGKVTNPLREYAKQFWSVAKVYMSQGGVYYGIEGNTRACRQLGYELTVMTRGSPHQYGGYSLLDKEIDKCYSDYAWACSIGKTYLKPKQARTAFINGVREGKRLLSKGYHGSK